jgi:hypothetical protein
VPDIPNVIEIDTITQSNSSSTSSQSSNNEPPSMKMIGMLEQFAHTPFAVKDENHFKSNFIKIITIVKITSDDRKPSCIVQRKPDHQSLMLPPRTEMRRLSENPRNINILHDIPREKKTIFKKRKSAMSSRSVGRKILAKLISMK